MEFILNEHHRNVPTEDILQDIREVALRLNKHTITIAEYDEHGKYSSSTIRRRLGSWKTVLEQADLDTEKHNFYIPNEVYINDLQRVASLLNKDSITSSEYRSFGKFDSSKLSTRFGSWENALTAANLAPTGYKSSVTDAELLEEIERIWIKLGHQPTTNDIRAGISKYSMNTYLRHFGSWRKALETFVEYINASETVVNSPVSIPQIASSETITHKTQRDINLRMRFLVMKRDNFKCCLCGASPAKDSNVELHIDHIYPWSKGGETTMDNLQTLCSKCNLGKSNLV